MKKISLFIVLVLSIAACKPMDIRPAEKRADFDSLSTGEYTIQNCINNAGGLTEWRNSGMVSFKITDEWYTKTYLTGSPWKQKKVDAVIDWNPGNTVNTRLNIEGTQVGYGVQSGRTYTAQGDDITETDKDLQRFYLNTVRYVIEMPFRAYEAPIQKYLGEVEIEGQKYHQVFYSWETSTPHKKHDQFILYVNTGTAQLEYATFTVRESNKKDYTSVKFSKFNTYKGFKIPNQIDFYFNQKLPGEKLSRTITVKHGAVGVARKEGYLTPLPDIIIDTKK